VPGLCEFYPDICLTTEENARKNLSQGSRRVPFGTMKTIVGVEGDCCKQLITMSKHKFGSVILGFRRKIDEICALLGYFGKSRRSHLQGSWISCPLKMGPICCPKTSVRNYHYTLRNIPADRLSKRNLPANTQNVTTRKMSMPLAGCESTIPGIKRPHTYAVNRAATGIGLFCESYETPISLCWQHAFL